MDELIKNGRLFGLKFKELEWKYNLAHPLECNPGDSLLIFSSTCSFSDLFHQGERLFGCGYVSKYTTNGYAPRQIQKATRRRTQHFGMWSEMLGSSKTTEVDLLFLRLSPWPLWYPLSMQSPQCTKRRCRDIFSWAVQWKLFSVWLHSPRIQLQWVMICIIMLRV